METLEPLPSIARGLGPSLPSREPAVERAPAGSPDQPSRGRTEAADRRPSPPASSDRRPAGPSPLAAKYRFDESANATVVVLIRPETDQVVRQIPPDKILRLIADLRDMVARILDKHA